MRSFILIVYISLSVTNLYAQVPNQFSAGDAVSAEKINENFTYASKRLVLKNNNIIIGDIICEDDSCFVITPKGYIAIIHNIFLDSVSLGSDQIYYLREDNSWTGGSCPNFTRKVRKRNYFLNSIVIGNDGSIGTYIKDSPSTDGVTNYIFYNGSSGSCGGGYNQSAYDLVSVTENNESITGFPNTIGTLTVVYE